MHDDRRALHTQFPCLHGSVALQLHALQLHAKTSTGTIFMSQGTVGDLNFVNLIPRPAQ